MQESQSKQYDKYIYMRNTVFSLHPPTSIAILVYLLTKLSPCDSCHVSAPSAVPAVRPAWAAAPAPLRPGLKGWPRPTGWAQAPRRLGVSSAPRSSACGSIHGSPMESPSIPHFWRYAANKRKPFHLQLLSSSFFRVSHVLSFTHPAHCNGFFPATTTTGWVQPNSMLCCYTPCNTMTQTWHNLATLVLILCSFLWMPEWDMCHFGESCFGRGEWRGQVHRF